MSVSVAPARPASVSQAGSSLRSFSSIARLYRSPCPASAHFEFVALHGLAEVRQFKSGRSSVDPANAERRDSRHAHSPPLLVSAPFLASCGGRFGSSRRIAVLARVSLIVSWLIGASGPLASQGLRSLPPRRGSHCRRQSRNHRYASLRRRRIGAVRTEAPSLSAPSHDQEARDYRLRQQMSFAPSSTRQADAGYGSRSI